MNRTRAFMPVLAAALVLAAGCGGGQDPTTAWADDFCSAISTWESSLTGAANSLTNNPSKAALQDASDEVTSATKTFSSDVKDLGKPPTDAQAGAQKLVTQLSDQIDSGVATIQAAIGSASGPGSVLSAVSTVSGTLATMGSQVTAAFADLQSLDPGGELQTAFKKADSCKDLRKQG